MTRHRFYSLYSVVIALTLGLFLGGWLESGVYANGGTNGLLDRMEKMTDQMAQSGELPPEQAEAYRQEVQALRQKVDERMQAEGSISPLKDKDLYNEIDVYNKPLFDAYQKSKAKVENDPRRLLNAPPF